MGNFNYKKTFLISLVIGLSISALIGIFTFLIGDIGETETRILLSTAGIGGFSLTGLCSATIHSRDELKSFGIIGMIIAVLGLLITLFAIWELITFQDVWQTMVVFIITSASIAHISLLLFVSPKTKTIKYFSVATITCISIVSLMLINSILTEFEQGEFYFRLLGVFAILDVLGTILTPVLNIVLKKDSETISNNETGTID